MIRFAPSYWPHPVMSDLLPCLDCGSDAVAMQLACYGDERRWEVICAACRARGPRVAAGNGLEDAVRVWNQRAGAP